MPKLSYVQEVAALEETLAAVWARADVLPPLALTVAGELAEQIATIRALKRRQREYAREGKVTTAALHAEIARGMVAARNIRAYVKLVYGPKDAGVTRFGIRIRRRPRRRVGSPVEVPADALGHVVEASAASRNAAWTAHAARANSAAIGADVQEVGGGPLGEGETPLPMGQRSSRLGQVPLALGR